jgi:hypothetical protein
MLVYLAVWSGLEPDELRDYLRQEIERRRLDEQNLRVVDVLETENDDPEMHFTVLVVKPL